MSTMDCEKYEPLLLDELYDELDELTSAAVKRHVSGCARCASVLNGMRATRRLAVLPVVDVPEGLADRILAAAREAQKVVPIRSRLSRAVSWAGSWAMRPQTAMAAVFLLMIGSSAFLLRAKRDRASEATVSVEVAGAPAPVAAAADHDSLDDPSAAAAHGAKAPSPVTLPPAPAATASALALAEPAGPLDDVTDGAGRDKPKDDESTLGSSLLASGENEDKKEAAKTRSAGRAGKAPEEIANAAAPAGAPMPDYGPQQQAAPPPPPATKRAGEPLDTFSAGMAAYRARRFAEATRQFDAAAANGDLNASLWAARSTRDGSGCAVALGRFDAIAQRASGSWHGSEAQLEAARCQINLGQFDGARQKLNALAQSATHGSQAQAALDELNQVAARKKASAGAGGGGAARPAAPAREQRAPAPKPASADKAVGF